MSRHVFSSIVKKFEFSSRPIRAKSTKKTKLSQFSIKPGILGAVLIIGLFALMPMISVTAFTTPVQINTGTGATYPDVASSGSHIYAVWNQKGVFLAQSSNGGSTWSTPLKLGSSSGFPIISASGSDVYVVWAASGHIDFVASTNSGGSFTKPVSVSGAFSAITPFVAASGLDVYVTFGSGASYITWSDNGGSSWGGTMQISTSTHDEAQVAATGTSAYAIADGSNTGGTNGVLMTQDGGSTWTRAQTMTDCCASEPWISANGTYVLAAGETKGTTSVVEEMYSADSGAHWSVFNVSQSIKDSWAPMTAISGSALYVAWRSNPGSSSSQEYISVNTAGTWSTPKAIGISGHDNEWPFTIVAGGSDANVLWAYATGSGSSGTWDEVAASTTNNGATWTAPVVLGTTVPENDIATGAAAMSGTTPYFVWQTSTGSIDFSS